MKNQPVKNKYGLGRQIPAAVERAVRQRCKFSCIVCQEGIYQYHHFNPTYEAAKEHNADGITLLCGKHHDYVKNNLLPDIEIFDANQRRKTEYPDGNILLKLRSPFRIVIGSILLIGQGPVIRIEDDTILEVGASETGGLILSGHLFDENDREVIVLDKNTLRIKADNWDVSVIGPTMTVRWKDRKIALEVQFHLPHGIHIRRFTMIHKGWKFETRNDGMITLGLINKHGEFQSAIELHERVIVTDGHMHLEKSCMRIMGETAILPYSGARFKQLSDRGDFEKLETELQTHSIYHVVAMPTGVWQVMNVCKQVLGQYTERDGAISNAKSIIRNQPGSWGVVHNIDGSVTHIYDDTP